MRFALAGKLQFLYSGAVPRLAGLMFYYTPYIIAPLLSAAVTGSLAVFAWRKRRMPVAMHVFWIMLIITVWSVCYALNTAATTLPLKVLSHRIATTFVSFISIPVLSMAFELIGYGDRVSRRRIALLAVVPSVTVFLVWTGDFHTLSRYGFRLVQSGPLLVLGFEQGLAWVLYLLYTNALNLVATVFFAIGFTRSPAGSRARFLLLIIGTLVPILVDGLNLTPVRGFSMTTSFLWFTGGCYVLAIFRHHLLKVAPLARATLFDRLSDPVLVFDYQGGLVDCNHAARQLFGARTDSGFAALYASALTRFPVLKTLSSSPSSTIDDFLQDETDDVHYWSITTMPLMRGGIFVGNLVQFHDISVLKRSEEELRRAHDASDAASRAKSAFLANMSHEIRTPMNAIIGLTDLVLDTDLTPEQKDYLETVKHSSDVLLTTLNDIMDFSKIEAGKMELEDIDFDLRRIIDASARMLSLQAENKGLKLDYYVGPEVPSSVKGDPVRLKQILLNLVGNAIKFTDIGEVKVTVQVEKPYSEEASGSREDRPPSSVALLFCIRDTGIGIPANKLESIFSSFTQADYSITRKFGGTGLGLSISRQLVVMMGGELKVESEVGKGSAFYFTARLRPGRTMTADPLRTAERPAVQGGRRNLKVLLVEDVATNRTVAIHLLEKRRHSVTSADHGMEALKILEKESFDVIFMDVQMPVMDGYKTAKFIRDPRSSVLWHDVPIIALTAHALSGDRERCIAAGMNGYVAKPIHAEELFAALEPYETSQAALPTPAAKAYNPAGTGTAEINRVGLLERYSGDSKLVEELLRVFGSEIPGLVRKVKEALDARDAALIEMRAHALKSAVGTVGFTSAQELAASIERAAKSGELDEATRQFQRLEAELQDFLNY